MDTINTLSRTAEGYVNTGLKNPYIMTVLKVALVLYAARIAPRIPDRAAALLDNTFVKIIALFLMAYIADKDFQFAVLFAVVFVIGTNAASGRGLLESFADYDPNAPRDTRFKLLEPQTMLYPGCQSLTMSDLLLAFEQDQLKLQTTVRYAYQELLANAGDKVTKERLMQIAYATGLPYNIQFNDENAPMIATLLMYYGFEFGDKCKAPQ